MLLSEANLPAIGDLCKIVDPREAFPHVEHGEILYSNFKTTSELETFYSSSDKKRASSAHLSSSQRTASRQKFIRSSPESMSETKSVQSRRLS